MADKAIQSYAKSWLSRVAIQMIVTVALGLVLCCLMVGIALIPESLVGSNVKPWLFIGSFGCLMGLFMAGVLATVLMSNRQIYNEYFPLGVGHAVVGRK